MSRLFYHVMQDNAGNLLFGVTGTMRLAGTGTLATIYGDEAMTIPLANPMTNHPSFGSFKCYLGPGNYDFYMAKAGYTFETLTGLQGLGTMAQQNASAVSISGTCDVAGLFSALGTARINTSLGLNTPPSTYPIDLRWLKGSGSGVGMLMRPLDSDTGQPNIIFVNLAAGVVGSISTTATVTAYNTSSDVRLKHAIAPLSGALGVVQALRPVAFRWNSDDSSSEGFLAHELQQVIPDAVTGTPDAVHEDGSVRPQQVDHSKLVPWLTAAVQALAEQVAALVGVAQDAHEQVQALTARVEAAGA